MRILSRTCRRGGSPSSGPDALVAAILPAILIFPVFPAVVSAEVKADASASVQYESNSNVFDQRTAPMQPGSNTSRNSDSYISEGATFNVDDSVGKEDLYLTGSVNQFHYDHLTDLDNTGYSFDGGLRWRLIDILNGNVAVSRSRVMTSFLDTSSTELSLQTTQRETAQASLKISSEWKLSGTGSALTTSQTQANLPDLRLSEQSGGLTLSYLGFGAFTSGFDVSYSSGNYTGGVANVDPLFQQSSYHQKTFDLVATYKAGGRTSFNGSLGYSARESASGDNNSGGVTGNLAFLDQLTPKTSISVGLSRAINSYISTAGSETDTSAQIGASWQATYKLGVQAGYTYTHREFPDQTLTGYAVGTELTDNQQLVSLSLNYQPARWIGIRGFGNLQTRHSSAPGDDFNGTIVGISIVVTTPKSTNRQ